MYIFVVLATMNAHNHFPTCVWGASLAICASPVFLSRL